MKKAVYREFDQYGEELSGHCARFAYRLMNFCVKAEEVALLPIEAMIDGDLVKLDDCSIVGKKDDYTFMIIPNFAEDMEAIALGVMMEHPEFKQSREEMTLDTVDEEGSSIKKDISYLLLKMPEVDDNRYKVLKDGVEVVYNECKAAMELANTKGEANITYLNEEWYSKGKESKNGFWTDPYFDDIGQNDNIWMADRVEETLTRLQEDAAHNSYSDRSMRLDYNEDE